ncbi:hypothetical protein [Mesonia aestuariivivens]|uniref:Outer membrane protein beta-barrel domain-containing protein n=1 Tax=Mesonia aestuariivivens TaxID=2796128 RepID=A0ABS6W4A4_9FLAO|nr:hypothetical protein [Mesonia aestuariivivens]MBW2962649.1 hypothetical protein [Mesonia aestuariivivens]
MKTIIINVAFFLALIVGVGVQAQVVQLNVINNIELKIEELQKQKNKIEKLEKDKLRQEVEKINERLESNEITATEAEELKNKAAEKRALNIQSQLTIIDENIALLERNSEQVESEDGEEKQEIDEYYTSLAFLRYDKKTDKFKDYDSIPSRTRKDIFVAFGLNHSLIDDVSLSDSPYKLGGSRFFEIGYGWNTMLNKAGWLRIDYGLSVQMNGIKAKDNQYFVEDEDQTNLKKYPYELDKAKLNLYNLVVPFHIELGKAKTAYGHDSAYYDLDHFKVGLGGYAGLNLGAKQKLKYEEDGKNKKEKIKEDYNVEKFVYGLSGYMGYGDWTLYAKYDLNTLFKDNPVEQHNVSLGVRVSL